MFSNSKIISILIWFTILIGLLYATRLYLDSWWELIFKLHIPSFLIAVLFSFLGFCFQAISWWVSVQEVGGKNYRLSKAISDHGITIFAKYIPGKIISVIGRAVLASKSTGLRKKDTSLASLNNQFFSILIGICCPIILLFVIDANVMYVIDKYNYIKPYIIIGIIIIMLFILFYYSYYLKKFVIKFSPIYSLFTAITYCINWIFWIIGFAFVSYSIMGEFSIELGAYFCLSVCFSILTIFSPGGLGVREAMFGTFVYMNSGSMEYAVILSLASRCWFLIGELLLFLYALFLLSLKRQGEIKKNTAQ